MAIKSSVEKITPEIAETILEASTDIKNRSVRDSHVDWLASQMKAGKWILNGEAIILDEENQVIDGQHRLFAVMQSGVTIESLVTRGVDRRGFATIDTGSARTFSNVLGIAGEKYAAAVAAAIAWTYRHDLGKMFATTKAIGFSHQVGLSVIKKHPGIRDSAEFVGKISKNPILKKVSASALIFLHYRFSAHSKEKTLEFFESVGDLRFDTEGTATRTLRNQILHADSEHSKRPIIFAMAFFVKAWTDFLNGTKPKRPYQWRRSGEFPEDFPKFPGEQESAGKAMKIVRRKSHHKKAMGE